MGLRAQAELDLGQTLESPADWGVAFTLADPVGFTGTEPLFGASGDIGRLVDPDTGQGVTGRHATLTVRIASLQAAGFAELPEGIADGAARPWVVGFPGASTPSQLYKVKQAHPDRTLGVVSMVVEFYRPSP